jgi:hypothetical protein
MAELVDPFRLDDGTIGQQFVGHEVSGVRILAPS